MDARILIGSWLGMGLVEPLRAGTGCCQRLAAGVLLSRGALATRVNGGLGGLHHRRLGSGRLENLGPDVG